MKKGQVLVFIILVTLYACNVDKNQHQENGVSTTTIREDDKVATNNSKRDNSQVNIVQKEVDSTAKKSIDFTLEDLGLVDIKEIDPSIRVELKYATSDNFMRRVLYQNLKRALLQKDVALRLSEVQKKLKSLHPNYSLLVYDAARPVSVQQKMWNALDTIPVQERGKFVSNPANRSLHNFGAAIDLTIVDGNGKPLDMGAGYDDIRKIAYPSLESKFLASGELTQMQVDNRKLLRSVMESERFRNIPTEWWHFNACSRDEAKGKYKVLMEEPGY